MGNNVISHRCCSRGTVGGLMHACFSKGEAGLIRRQLESLEEGWFGRKSRNILGMLCLPTVHH